MLLASQRLEPDFGRQRMKAPIIFLLTLGLLLPATLTFGAKDAEAQQILRDSRTSGKRTHKQAGKRHKREARRDTRTERRTTRTTTQSSGHVVHRPVHRHNVTHHRSRVHHRDYRHRTHVRYGRYGHTWGYRYVWRPRYYSWGTREVHHHHRPVVIHIEEPEPELPELECSPRTEMRQTERETWCATDRGHRHGPYVRYHQNGDVAQEGWYEYGTKEGIWMSYHTNGAIKSEGAFQNNLRVGIWTNYNRDGEQISATEYQ